MTDGRPYMDRLSAIMPFPGKETKMETARQLACNALVNSKSYGSDLIGEYYALYYQYEKLEPYERRMAVSFARDMLDKLIETQVALEAAIQEKEAA